jgi:hypothetical protein
LLFRVGSPGGADDPDSKRARRDSFGPWGDPKKKYLYYCPQMAELAASIAQQAGSASTLNPKP